MESSNQRYFDIHTHILPGVDDGADTIETSLEMIDILYEEGVRTIFLTPHFVPGTRNKRKDDLVDAYRKLQAAVNSRYDDCDLVLGNEIYYREGTLDYIKKKETLTLGDSKYILIEFNVQSDYKKLQKAIREIVQAGYRPIIAHAERYQCLYKDISKVEELIEAGAYIQINTSSLLGGIFNPIRRMIMKWLKQGCVHFVGSDAHNMKARKPVYQKAIMVLQSTISQEYYNDIVLNNGQRVLYNKFIT